MPELPEVETIVRELESSISKLFPFFKRAVGDKTIDKERKEQDTKSLDEAMDEVTGFIDTELGIGVSPRPKPQQSQQQAPQNDAQQETPLNEENKQFALDPSQPVVMPGEPTGLENDSS